jgi:hypothetical protein
VHASDAISNSGTLTIENHSTLQGTGYSQSAGTTTVVGGSTLIPGEDGALINHGTLTGTGTVTTGVTNGGTVNPSGTVSGPMTVSGDYSTSGAGANLTIPVSDVTHPGTGYGQLSVSGAASIGGPLHIVTAHGYLPPLGTALTLLSAASVTGTFSSVTGTELGDRHYTVGYTPTSVVATVTADTPQVTSVAPDAGPTTGGNTVVIHGSGFGASPKVKFGGVSATVVSSNFTQITVTAPAASAAGRVDVHVTTTGGATATSSADSYTYGRPTITAVTPDAGATAGGNTVAINGNGFTSDSTVKFGSALATVVSVSPTRITVTAPAEGSSSRVTVYVGNPAGYTAGPVYTYGHPTVTRLSPSSGPAAGGNTVTITGTGVTPDSTVEFGSTAASVSSVTPTQIKVAAPAKAAGRWTVYVHTPAGYSAASAAAVYTYGP